MPGNIYQTVRHSAMTNKAVGSIIGLTLKALKKPNYELSLHLVGDKKMRALNRRWRGFNRTTDVLAFAAQEDALADSDDLGDIFISVAQIKKQAKARELSYQEEFARILIHGILHLLGFDHGTRAEEKKMFGLQERILNEYITHNT